MLLKGRLNIARAISTNLEIALVLYQPSRHCRYSAKNISAFLIGCGYMALFRGFIPG